MGKRATWGSGPRTPIFPSSLTPYTNIDVSSRDTNASSDSQIQQAVAAYRLGGFTLIRACTRAFSIKYQTLQARLSGRLLRSQAYKRMQILSKPEERTLIRWIIRLTNTGFPTSLALVREIAEEIRRNRLQLSYIPTSYPRPIGSE